MNEDVDQDPFQFRAVLHENWFGEMPSMVARHCGRLGRRYLEPAEHITLETLNTQARLVNVQIDCLSSASRYADATDLRSPMHMIARNWFDFRGNLWKHWFATLRNAPAGQWGIGAEACEAEQLPVDKKETK